jgi:hypothetical protein
MTNHYNETSYYGNTDPIIYYGDGWFYGAVLPKSSVAVPSNIYVLHERDYNIISWENSREGSDPKKYILYRSKTFGHADYTPIATIESKDLNGLTQTCYIDYLTENETDVQYYYAVVAVDNSGYQSLLSDWSADINMDQPYQHYKYLYTDQMTQTYWNTLDLMDKLGNFDTDRNIIPFRDLGNNYTQELDQQGNVINKPVKKDCNYLYATLLTLTDEQKDSYKSNQLRYSLYLDEELFAENTPQTLTSVNITKTDTGNSLLGLSLNKETFLNAVEADINDENSLELEYVSEVDVISGGKAYNGVHGLEFDREKFLNKGLSQQSGIVKELPKQGISFRYTNPANGIWTLNGWVFSNVQVTTAQLADYGLTFSPKTTKLLPYMVFLIKEYWVEKVDEETSNIITSKLDTEKNLVTLYTTENVDYGMTYTYCLPDNKVNLLIDYSKKAFLYFRVPYIYDSKLLQTYVIDNVSERKINNITFKTYNYLIFPSTLGKVFNQKQIELKEIRGNLYKTDAASSAIYQNFGSFFKFEQPAWLADDRYRRCVLGNENTPGMLDAGMHGGTFRGIKEVINALSQGEAELTDQSSISYLEAYTNYEVVPNLSTIQLFNASNTYNEGDIIAYSPELESIGSDTDNTQYTLTISSITPSDASLTFYGNGVQEDNSMIITAGTTSLNTTASSPDYLISGCSFSNVVSAPDVPYTYIQCVDSSNAKAFQIEGSSQYFINVDNEYKNKTVGIQSGNVINVYRLKANNWNLIMSIPATAQTDWIFKERYDADTGYYKASITDPLSYTHNYVTNTWNLKYTEWKQSILGEKYTVYGNTIKLNNDSLIKGTQVEIKKVDTDETYSMGLDFTVNYNTGYITWINSNTKPEDGTFVLISYDVDIRKEIIRLVDLIKYPQVNINYIWSEEQ